MTSNAEDQACIAHMAAIALALFAFPLSAQQASALRVGVSAPVHSYQGLYRERPDTFPPHPKRTYWKEGALIAGIPAAIGGYFFVSGMEDSRMKGLAGGLYAGVIMGAVGAFTGWFFAKPEQPATGF